MSEFTPEQILKMIEEHGGPPGLALPGKDLSRIDLSSDWIQAEMARRGLTAANPPPWFATDTKGINLQGARLEGANLQGARLVGASLQDARLEGASLQGARLGWANLQGADLEGASLQGAWLLEANLQGACLEGANLQGADLTRAKLQGARLLGANLLRTPLTAACLGRRVGEELSGGWSLAREEYLALKANFLSLGQYDDARWAAIRERRMERRAYRPRLEVNAPLAGKGLHRRAWRWLRLRAREWGVGLRHPWASLRWLWNWMQDFFTDYLTNPYKVAALVPATALLFAVLYWLAGSWGLGESLIFSARTLVTLAFSDMSPDNLWAKALTPIEGAVGVSLFALFVYCLGRRTAGY